MTERNIIQLKNISKSFPGVKALDSVNLSVLEGHVHGLIGENGAGKSTLMKILSGVYQRDEGEIYFDGTQIPVMTPQISQDLGISIIYQEFNLVSVLSIAENIFLGRLGCGKRKRIVRWSKINAEATALLRRIGYEMDVTRKVGELSVAQMQMVEIAKALSYNARLLIMDEPSAPLTSNELETFFEVVKTLKEQGVTIIFISHKLDEIMKLCDEVTVMRDGAVIDTCKVTQTSKEDIIQKIIGRTMNQEFPRREPCVRSEVILKAENVHVRGKIESLSFELHRGEILGFVGLVGAGRTETVRALFGVEQHASCEVCFKGEKIRRASPAKSIHHGMMLLPEDRKQQGLFLNYSVEKNISATNLRGIQTGAFLDRKKERRISEDYIHQLSIKTPSAKQVAMSLSGGNQQKVVVAKALFMNPDVLIMDEPTRGIDVGAKYDIYLIMNRLVAEGKAILFISSELNEVLGMSDRILVLYDKKIQGEFTRDEFSNSHAIASCMLGHTTEVKEHA